MAGSELDRRVAFYPTQQPQHRKSHFKASPGGSCGGVGGVLGHPLNCLSTGTPKLPARPLLQVTGTLGAQSSPSVFAVLLQGAAAKDGARWSQPVPTNSAHCWGPRQTRATVLIVSRPFWLASLLLEVGVQASGVFPVLPVGLGVRLRSLRSGLIS